MDIKFYIAKIMSKIKHSHAPMINYYRSKGIVIGNDCLICSNIVTQEAFLISIGDNVTISTGVSLLTHDYSSHIVIPGSCDLYGKITIGNNCFIGANSTILYGVTLADNIVVAAGSVVTRSFENNNIIIGGNPAKIIGSWENYRKKYGEVASPTRKELSFTDLCAEFKKNKYLVHRDAGREKRVTE